MASPAYKPRELGFLSYFKKGQRVKNRHGEATAIAALQEDLVEKGLTQGVAEGLARDILNGEDGSFQKLVKEEELRGVVVEPDEGEIHPDCGCEVHEDHVSCSCQGSGVPTEKAPQEPQNQVRVFKASSDSVVIYGPASVSIVDSENDLITGKALKAALPQLLERGRFSLQHTDIIPGSIEKSWEAPDGTVYKTEVREVTPGDIKRFKLLQRAGVEPGTDALFVVGKIWTNDPIGKDVAEEILKGNLSAFSISGQALETSSETDCSGFTCKLVNRIDKIGLSAVTICREGMNQGSGFQVVQKGKRVFVSDDEGRVFKFTADEEGCISLTRVRKGVDVEPKGEFPDHSGNPPKEDDLEETESVPDNDNDEMYKIDRELRAITGELTQLEKAEDWLDTTLKEQPGPDEDSDDEDEENPEDTGEDDYVGKLVSSSDPNFDLDIILKDTDWARKQVRGLDATARTFQNRVLKNHVDREEALDVHNALNDFRGYIRELCQNLPDGDLEWLKDAVKFIESVGEEFQEDVDEHAAHKSLDKQLDAIIGVRA